MENQAAHNDASQLASEFKEYAYSVSHDLSAPVRAMVEFSKILASEHGDIINPERKEYLTLIVDNGQKLQRMMEGLLQYSRLNTMAKPFTDVDVGLILQDCKMIMQPEILSSRAEITIGDMPIVYADPDQLKQLFIILLTNAIVYQPEGQTPKIEISAEEKDAAWEFSIADNGIGIAPKFHKKIFGIFQRLHTDEEYTGVGMGLKLAHKILQRHAGDIWCESMSNNGTVFHFRLPISPKMIQL